MRVINQHIIGRTFTMRVINQHIIGAVGSTGRCARQVKLMLTSKTKELDCERCCAILNNNALALSLLSDWKDSLEETYHGLSPKVSTP